MKTKPGIKTTLYMRMNGVHYAEGVIIFSKTVRRNFSIKSESIDEVFARLARLRSLVDDNHPRGKNAV